MSSFDDSAQKYRNSFKTLQECFSATNNSFNLSYFESGADSFWPNLKIGSIYSFEYKPKFDPKFDGDFIDRRPLLILLPIPSNSPRNTIFGIDLNLVPFSERANILSTYSKVLGYDMKDDKANTESIESTSSKLSYNSAKRIFDGSGFESAYYGFKVQYIPGFKFISPDDWIKIPYLNLSRIEGSTLNLIYSNYGRKK
jgi:hypothetical protein